MEAIITRLVAQFESGQIDRRQLIQGIGAAAAAALIPRRAAAQPLPESPYANGFQVVGIDHISMSVKDYARTRDFYRDLLGMSIEDYGDGRQSRMFWGATGPGLSGRPHTIARTADFSKTPAGQPTASIGHISYQIADWDTDKVEAELKRRGLDPRLDTGTEGRRPWASFHVKDPDGYDLQISGDTKPGDRLHKS